MGGIFCYAGLCEAEPILVQGLLCLEHHGYDSVGLATVADDGRLHVRKCAGRLAELLTSLEGRPALGRAGIAQLRQTSLISPTVPDVPPQLSFDGKVAVVYDGVIDNHATRKRQVEQDGIPFYSQTDAEVVAQLLTCHLVDDLLEAVCAVLPLLHGAAALAAISVADPGRIIGACLGRPLLLGYGAGYAFLTDDAAALPVPTPALLSVRDHQVAELTADGCRLLDPARLPIRRSVFQLS
jgi:glucosamine--fructose-6-phosphate aminotransferase (isomerizing)